MSTREIEGLLRQMAPQVLGALVRRYGHFDTAEDAVQEALIAAATQWPSDGVPDKPRAWLITVASRKLTDLLRSEQARQRREAYVWREEAVVSDADDTLILLFMCCHPALSPASQIALTLRAVGGLTTAEVARAFLKSCQVRTWRPSQGLRHRTCVAELAAYPLARGCRRRHPTRDNQAPTQPQSRLHHAPTRQVRA